MTEKESSIQYTPGMKAFTDPEDRKFCGKCRFAAPEQLRQDYLCDYLQIAGGPRGCPPGRGCTKREPPDAPGPAPSGGGADAAREKGKRP